MSLRGLSQVNPSTIVCVALLFAIGIAVVVICAVGLWKYGQCGEDSAK